MINDNIPDGQINVLVVPEPVELVLNEDGASPLSVVLAPIEDLREMSALAGNGFSIKKFAQSDIKKAEARFAWELSVLAKKKDRFEKSPIFFNRLANLALAAGNLDAEARFLGHASELSNETFFLHKKGANYLARDLRSDAEQLFASFDLNKDLDANLRLAYFHIQKNNLTEAALRVGKAVQINSLDFGARLFEGAIRLIQGQYEQAIHSFRIASEERPSSSALFSNLAIAYAALRRPEKALTALRRAVALNPLNLTAVTLLADISFSEKRNEDAVPSLRYYLQFEQNNPTVWARLSRALLELGQADEAIAALKRQGSIEKTSSLWNNLGVAYHRKNDLKKALESFKHAMELADDIHGGELFLPARNAAAIFSQKEAIEELLSFTELVLALDAAKTSLANRELSDLVMFRVHALFRSGKIDAAVRASEAIILNTASAPSLVAWAATGLLSWYCLNEDYDRALTLAGNFTELIDNMELQGSAARERLINNLAFVYADVGHITTAEHFLSLISNTIHKEPYPTATLGLVHLRKGHIEHAVDLYKEAIHISHRASDKARIKQKLNVELGKHLMNIEDTSRARRYLTKAVEEKDGEKGLVIQAKRLLLSLPNSMQKK